MAAVWMSMIRGAQAFTIYRQTRRLPRAWPAITCRPCPKTGTAASGSVRRIAASIASIGGVDRLSTTRPTPTNPRRLGHPWVAALEPDPKGALWVGTYGGGLYRLDPARDRFTAYRHDPANPRSLSHDAIADLHMDRSGTLWIGTRGGGLNRFDPASGTFTVYRHDPANPQSLSSDWVWAIAEDRAAASGSARSAVG